MTHDIFISFSTRDRTVADSLKQYLDGHGMSCWMSAAAIDGGEVWTRAIVDGITGARAMVLLLSANSNASEHVRREIYLARERHLRIIPFRIDDVEPDGDLAYNLAGIQWLQGSPEPTEAEFERLAQSVRAYLSRSAPPQAADGEAAARPADPPGRTAEASGPAASDRSSPEPLEATTTVLEESSSTIPSSARQVDLHAEPVASNSPRDLNPLIGFIAIVVVFGGLLLAGKIFTSL